MQKQQYSCQHFCRKVKVVCPDCQETHGCHYCHDAKWEFAKKKSHIMRWKEVEQIVCAKCQTKQPVSNQCIRQKCGNKFGNYFCAQCRVWTFNPQPIFHCDDCNTCHQAIKGQVKHCSSCKMCINKEEFEEHQNHCNPQKLLDDCCICQEPLLRGLSDIKRVPCGHLMHSHCVEQYAVAKIEDFYKGDGFTIGCPLCKKSILPITDPEIVKMTEKMDEFVSKLAPIGENVSIYCYECEKMYTNQVYKQYMKCPECNFYNTKKIE